MVIEAPQFIPICPYWRRFIIYGDRILALCGIEKPKSKPYPDTDLGPRLQFCPWHTKMAPYRDPVILEKTLFGRPNLQAMIQTLSHGAEAIAQLEQLWPKEVERFYKRYSQ